MKKPQKTREEILAEIFETIADDAIDAAESVACSPEELRQGLLLILDKISEILG